MTDSNVAQPATQSFAERWAGMIGEWQGETKTWFEPGNLADESPTVATIEPILGGTFLLHRYTGTLLGEAFEGQAIYGFYSARGKFESAWVDGAHMGDGMMFSSGEALPDGFTVTGQYAVVGEPHDWGWRTVMRLLADDELLVAAYTITPDGEEALGVETRCGRLKP